MKVVYIDAQNVYRRITDRGWVLDRYKFYNYLKDHLNPDIVYFAVGYLEVHKKLYKTLISYGYTMLYKEVSIKPDGSIKGNVDIDIALRTALDLCEEGLSVACIVTNDGDYNSLLTLYKERGILGYLIAPDISKVSKLLTNKTEYIIDMQEIQHLIQKQKDLASNA